MRRRRVLRAIGTATVVASAGCLERADDRETPSPTSTPARVTTTGGDDVRILGARAIFHEEQDGPRVNYRLRNDGSADATVAVRTVIDVDGGGRYEGTAYADVPADGEVVVEYRVVAYSALSDDEERAVRRGEAEFEVYVNGERRDAF